MGCKLLIVFLVAWLATFCAVANAGVCGNFRFDKGQFPNIPHKDTDAAVERNATFHMDDIWAARLLLLSINNTAMLVRWDMPRRDRPYYPRVNNTLCAFRLHYYRATGVQDSHESVFIRPSETQYLVTGLAFGTLYHAYIEALFDQNVAGQNTILLKSWILIAKTKGVGPDSPCNCMAVNTVGHTAHDCDRQTGQCPCKNFGSAVIGRQCDQCVNGHYLHPRDGCVACDRCPKDELIGNGSCHYLPGEMRMQCECTANYSGVHCEQCQMGFYRVNDYCRPCDCNGNENPGVTDFCDQKTGRCMACAYHTTGDHCELCYPGHVGNALDQSCIRMSTVAHDVGIGFLCVIIIVIIVVVAVLMFRRFARRRRRLHFLSSVKGGPLGSTSAVNFVTMIEEPEMEFQPHDRQLQIIGSAPPATST